MLNKNSVKFTEKFCDNILIRETIKEEKNFCKHIKKKNLINLNLQKKALEHLKIIGQFDKKFLITITNENKLIIFDQHAVHERILYEHYYELVIQAINFADENQNMIYVNEISSFYLNKFFFLKKERTIENHFDIKKRYNDKGNNFLREDENNKIFNDKFYISNVKKLIKPNERINNHSHLFTKFFLEKKIKVVFDEKIFSFMKKKFNLYQVNSIMNFDFNEDNENLNCLKLNSVPIILNRILTDEFYIEIFKKLILFTLKFYIYQCKLFMEKNDNRISCNLNFIKYKKNIIEPFLKIIKSRSCRDAIKFNEKLNKDLINHIIYNLNFCKNPFLCAHGRHNFFIIKEKNN